MSNEQPAASKRPKWRTTILVSYGLLITGLFLISISIIGEHEEWPIWLNAFVRDLGLLLAAVLAGSILHEKLLRHEMLKFTEDELRHMLDARISKPEELAITTARAVHRVFTDSPPGMTGLRLLGPVRRNLPRYYEWVNNRFPQDLFFAGRSVLHRIDADIKINTANTESSAEAILVRRLKEGCKIQILLLDPRIDIIERLAREEGQSPEEMLGDIETSVQICKRLSELLLANKSTLQSQAQLTISLYNRVPYFAYHRTDSQAIVGFYFMSNKGSASPAYELVDPQTKQTFSDHFVLVHNSHSETLVEFDGPHNRVFFNNPLYKSLTEIFDKKLRNITKDRSISSP